MTLSDELQLLVKKQQKIVAEGAADLLAELIARTPVSPTLKRKDGTTYHTGGTLKSSWDMVPVGDGWLLTNNMNYASFIFNGLREVAGKKLGSTQLPDGVAPIIQKHNKIVQRRLNAL